MIKKTTIRFLFVIFALYKLPSASAETVSKACTAALNLALNEKWTQAYQALPAHTCPLTADVIQWLDLKNDNRHHSFSEYQQFIQKHPDWPWAFMLRKRAESKIDAHVPDAVIIQWYLHNPVQNSKAGQRYVKSLMNTGQKAKAIKVIQHIWINCDFKRDEEQKFRAAYSSYLKLRDHHVRIDRLLWEGKIQQAQSMLSLLDADHRLLNEARISIIEQDLNASQKLAKVPKYLKQDLGIIYDQVYAYHKTDNLEGARLLLAFKPHFVQLPQHQQVVWKEYRYFAREALNQGQADLAYQVLKNHKFLDAKEYSEAEWFLGWVALCF